MNRADLARARSRAPSAAAAAQLGADAVVVQGAQPQSQRDYWQYPKTIGVAIKYTDWPSQTASATPMGDGGARVAGVAGATPFDLSRPYRALAVA